jgi:hypothetical protein
MRILEQRTYVGPNLYATFPVIRLTLDLGPLEDRPSATLPGFVEQLSALIAEDQIYDGALVLRHIRSKMKAVTTAFLQSPSR